MRARSAIVILIALPAAWGAAKLTFEDRVELTRGLTAEYATAKALIPHTRKTLEVGADGSFDQAGWTSLARDGGPAARPGDLIQITKIDIGSDRIVLEINGGFSGGKKWYRNIQVGMGASSDPAMRPIGQSGNANAPGGAAITLDFHKPLEPMKASAVKNILSTIFEFDKHSAAEVYIEALDPEVRQAVKDGKAVVGMDKDQVILAMGRPLHRSRETQNGVELEDWVYGLAPGKITFVTFKGDKAVKVKEEYAGLGAVPYDPPRN